LIQTGKIILYKDTENVLNLSRVMIYTIRLQIVQHHIEYLDIIDLSKTLLVGPLHQHIHGRLSIEVFDKRQVH
jgi:hypothetical protein